MHSLLKFDELQSPHEPIVRLSHSLASRIQLPSTYAIAELGVLDRACSIMKILLERHFRSVHSVDGLSDIEVSLVLNLLISKIVMIMSASAIQTKTVSVLHTQTHLLVWIRRMKHAKADNLITITLDREVVIGKPVVELMTILEG